MKLPADPRLPLPNDKTLALTQRLYDLFREIARAFNASAMWDSEGTASPTTGAWAQGNTLRNTSPVESGTAGSKYVVLGWVCVSSGTPGTWKEIRTLTGG